MIYKRRNLQRLFKCTVYKGDKDAKKPKTETITCLAWNDVDVFRKIGDRLAKPPAELCHVFQDEKGQYLEILDTSGPTDKVLEPDVL